MIYTLNIFLFFLFIVIFHHDYDTYMYGMGHQKPERNFAESPKLIPDMEDPIS
jgi:hypothetical protein